MGVAAGAGAAWVPTPALAPPARTRSVPAAVTAVRETSSNNPGNPAAAFVRPAPAGALSPALAHMLDTTLLVASTAEPDGPPGFEAAVKADLHAVYSTPTGKLLLESLHASGRKIYINYGEENRAGFPYNPYPALYQEDGVTPGQGVSLSIEYNPFIENTGAKPWNRRPPAIGLAHELIHAEQAAHGRMRRGIVKNPGGLDEDNSAKPLKTPIFELEAIGVPPYDKYPVTENKIRSEWNPPQTSRSHY